MGINFNKGRLCRAERRLADVDTRAERRHTSLLVAMHLEERVKREERAAPREQRT